MLSVPALGTRFVLLSVPALGTRFVFSHQDPQLSPGISPGPLSLANISFYSIQQRRESLLQTFSSSSVSDLLPMQIQQWISVETDHVFGKPQAAEILLQPRGSGRRCWTMDPPAAAVFRLFQEPSKIQGRKRSCPSVAHTCEVLLWKISAFAPCYVLSPPTYPKAMIFML